MPTVRIVIAYVIKKLNYEKLVNSFLFRVHRMQRTLLPDDTIIFDYEKAVLETSPRNLQFQGSLQVIDTFASPILQIPGFLKHLLPCYVLPMYIHRCGILR